MALKVYRARSMQDALAEVKRDLGPNAMILNTRSYRSRGVLGFGGRPIVEITATADTNPQTRPGPAGSRRSASPSPKDSSADAPFERDTAAPAASSLRHAAAAQAYGRGIPPAVPTGAAVLDVPAQPNGRAGTGLAAPVAPERPGVPQPGPRSDFAVEPKRLPVAASNGNTRNTGPVAAGVEDELRSIKRMVSTLMQSSTRSASGGAMSDPLFEQYLRLQENAVAAEIADEIIGRVRDELSQGELADAEIVRETMLREIAGLIPSAGDAAAQRRPIDDRAFTVALVGPTGVGKTTTVAKLAARAKLRHGRSVGLITTDTYRIAAVEQLRTYAEIIGLPLQVVSSPGEMHPAIDSMAELDEVYIDTAGRSQHDETRLAELRAYLDEADPHEIHLVLSSVASEAVLMRAADNFGRLGPNRVLFTKLDEAVETGVLLGVIRRVGVALSFVTTGQEVPDHIEPGHPERLARQILSGSVQG